MSDLLGARMSISID